MSRDYAPGTRTTASKKPYLSALLAAAGQVPIVGVSTKTLEARNQRAYRERIEQSLEWLDKELRDAKFDANQKFLNTQHFVSLLQDTLNEIGITRDEEHREYLRNFLLGAARQQDPDPFKARRILRLLEYLEPVQVRLLYLLREMQGNASPVDYLVAAVNDLNRDEAIEQLQELRRLGLYNNKAERQGALLVPVIDDAGERQWDDRELTPRALELLSYIAHQ